MDRFYSIADDVDDQLKNLNLSYNHLISSSNFSLGAIRMASEEPLEPLANFVVK
jgi:hypothetical protein